MRNLGAVLLAALPVADVVERFCVEGLHVDDVVVQGTALKSRVANVSISQLDIRDANLEDVEFDSVAIVTLIANTATRVSESFPDPSSIQDMSGETLILDPADVRRYIDHAGRRRFECGGIEEGVGVEKVRDDRLYRLLEKVCRVRHYWIRDDSDDRAAKLINNESWAELIELLREHELVREELREAAGRRSTFYHVKKTREILARDKKDEQVQRFLAGIERRIRERRRMG